MNYFSRKYHAESLYQFTTYSSLIKAGLNTETYFVFSDNNVGKLHAGTCCQNCHKQTQTSFNANWSGGTNTATVTLSTLAGRKVRRVNLYPNPTNGPVRIETENINGEMKVTVYTVLGSEVLSRKFYPGSEARFDLSSCPPGIYIVRLNFGEAEIIRKIILDKQK